MSSSVSNAYQSEIDDFRRNFAEVIDKKIVLYGIGRMTMTILDCVTDYHFVGLLDRDEKRIGTIVHGLPIVSIEEAKKNADLVIINTSATYWNMIYRRISDIGIPVYYKNGILACIENEEETENPFWSVSDDIMSMIDNSDIVAFDFYDTLFARKVMFPGDVFTIMEKEIDQRYSIKSEYTVIRNNAKGKQESCYSLNDLYNSIFEESKWKKSFCDEIEKYEIEFEEKLLCKRTSIIDYLLYAKKKNKELFIVSDMYLPIHFYGKVLEGVGCPISDDHILVSNAFNRDKQHGLWEEVSLCSTGTNNTSSINVICIGDSIEKDIRCPQKNGYKTRWVPSVYQLFQWSSVRSIINDIKGMEASALMGLVTSRLFSDPYALNKSKGRVVLSNPVDVGYCVYGPVVLEFFRWIRNEANKDNISNICFLARDGFFLIEDYDYYCKLNRYNDSTEYIAISRQLSMLSRINTIEDLIGYLKMPYSGTVKELLQDRLHINYQSEIETVDELCNEIKKNEILVYEMMEYVNKVKTNYSKYLTRFHLDNKTALIDLGYHGNNLDCLNSFLGKQMKGYFFNADLSEANPVAIRNEMKACFQDDNDPKALSSNIYMMVLYIESLLTAPYGMIEEVDSNGEYLCKPKGRNQLHFDIKREINEGIKEFIADYSECFSQSNIDIDPMFADRWYGVCFQNGIDLSDSIKLSFYNDNAFMNRFDNPLFDIEKNYD